MNTPDQVGAAAVQYIDTFFRNLQWEIVVSRMETIQARLCFCSRARLPSALFRNLQCISCPTPCPQCGQQRLAPGADEPAADQPPDR